MRVVGCEGGRVGGCEGGREGGRVVGCEGGREGIFQYILVPDICAMTRS